MDAVKFLMESNRICQSSKPCGGCPMSDCCVYDVEDINDAIKTVAAVEKWSEEHPVVTNGMKVHEMIPGNERRTVFKEADPNLKGCGLMTSEDYVEMRIRRSWWDAEYREESNDL